MEKAELADGTNLYFEHYQVIQYVANELRPAAEDEIKAKLLAVLTEMDDAIDGTGGLSVLRDDDALSIWVYASEDWAKDEVSEDVAAFLKLRWDFKDTNAMSTLGISCEGAPAVLKALQAVHDDGEEWLEELSRAHGTKKYDQFYRELDWYEEFATFEEMKTALEAEVRELANGLQQLLTDKGITP